MPLRNFGRLRLQQFLVVILLFSLGIHLMSLVLGKTTFIGWTWVHVPLHSVLEATGALVAVVVAFLLITLERRDEGTNFNLIIAGALLGMGILDGFHAMVHVGHLFVWFHTVSTFLGGVLFLLVWLPPDSFKILRLSWPNSCALVVTAIGVFSIVWPQRIPAMTRGSGFTELARTLNLVGGLFLLGASVRLMVSFRRGRNVDDMLFSLHCLLFGAAGLMFEQSTLWGFTWWGWHVLRLLAYGAALLFAVDTFLRDQRTLQQRKESLEEQVRDRTLQLEKALDEKEMLLKEIHHRVKNNMQVISSMLSLQANQIEDRTVRERFEESLNRIHSMALVHDLLYQSDDLGRVDFQDYVHRLVDELVMSMLSDESQVTIELNIQNHPLTIDTAVRCGLIINELITNSLQHAFDGTSEGTLRVEFGRREDRYELTVSDNGSGFQPAQLSQGNNSLGLELVEALVTTDLQGELEVNGSNGTAVTVTFTEPESPV